MFILENDYTENQRWLQTYYWIRGVSKCMSANHINISHLLKEVSTQRTHDTCIISHLALKGDFTTSGLQDIN